MSDSLLDQGMRVEVDAFNYAVASADKLIGLALECKSDEYLAGSINDIRLRMQLQGLTLACVLSEWKHHTDCFGVAVDDWEDHVFTTTGLAVQTVRKYVDVWETVFQNPAVSSELRPILAAKPMTGLLLLPAAVREEQLDDDAWQKIADAPDSLAIRDVVRKVRGEATSSKTAISLGVARDGTIWAYRGDYAEPVGMLNLKPSGDPEAISLVEAATSRIMRESGMRQE